MVFYKKIRFFVLLFLFVNFSSLIFSVGFPSLDFSTNNFASGQVDISGKASSGVELELYVNENYIGKQNIISEMFIVNLTDEIIDTSIPIAATLRFVNNNPSKNFTLNISNFGFKVLEYGESFDFFSYEEGVVTFRNEETSVQKNIRVVDSLIDFNFTEISQSYLLDGENNLTFNLNSLQNSGNFLESLDFSIVYDKYSNTISLSNFTNVTNSREIKILGSVSDSSSPLRYVLNYDGQIVNTGMLREIETSGNGIFNVTISNLVEGINSIRLITIDKDNSEIFNGENIVKVLVDTIPPTIDILSATYDGKGSTGATEKRNADFSSGDIFINGNVLKLNLSTDSVVVNYTFNSKNDSCGEVINETVQCSFNLVKGQNNLTLIGIDIAGNIVKVSHAIHFDNTPINFYQNELEPKAGSTVHFFLQDVKGKVNKGDVRITAFTMPSDASYFYEDDNGVRVERTATCSNYNFPGVREVGNVDYSTVGPEYDLPDEQISLLDLIRNKVTVNSDSDGRFEFKILEGNGLLLKEKNLDRDNRASNQISDVNSPNTICFIMSDRYGNVATQSSTLILDQGNTLWTAQDVNPTPSTIYAAEIEQTGDVRSGTGYVRVGVIARIRYVGGGRVKSLSSPIVSIDRNRNQDLAKYGRVVTSEVSYLLDKDSNEMILYFPVEIRPMNIKPLDYPSEIKLGFKVSMNYALEETEIPIDVVNPIYFQTSLNIERPLDTAKWLSPATLDEYIGYLEESIKFTKQAVEYTGIASIVGVVACTGAKFYYGAKMALTKDKKDKNDLKEKLFYVCDRVICSEAPTECDGNSFRDNAKKDDPGILELEKKKTYYTEQELSNIQILNSENKRKSATFDSLSNVNENNLCDFDGDGVKDDGIYINGRSTNWGQNTGGNWFMSKTDSQYRFNGRCVSYKKGGLYDKDGKYVEPGKEGKYTKKQKAKSGYQENSLIDLKSVSDVCYSDKAPKFDNTRTISKPGWNPKDNIIESIGSVCITDTYSHLKNYLQIQEAIKRCLEDAKIGVTKGSYCERLMSQAVCDIATNVFFKTIAQKTKATPRDKVDPHDNPLVTAIQGAQDGDKLLNDRYDGNAFYSQAELGTSQIVNKVCLASLTGDWSVLSDNILASIDKNQIEPTFGPMFPESRMQGYNPLTGDLSIRYMFTYAAISGGQYINTKVEFFCDKQKAGGEYCPDKVINSVEAKSRFSMPTLYIARGDSRQDSIVITDSKAQFRYNEIVLTHTYELDGKKKTKEQRSLIFPKDNGLLAECDWNGGLLGSGVLNDVLGIKCNALFGPESLVSMYSINDRKTKLVPANRGNVKPIYYLGNNVLVNLFYNIRDTTIDGAQTNFNLYYKAYCSKEGPAAFNWVDVEIGKGGLDASQLIPIIKIPSEFGEDTTEQDYYTSFVKVMKKGTIKGIKISNLVGAVETNKDGTVIFKKIIVRGKVSKGELKDYPFENIELENNKLFKDFLKSGDADIIEIEKVTLQSEKNIPNINIKLELKNGETMPFPNFKKQKGDKSTTELQNIQTNSPCTIEMRLLPADQELSEADFSTYNVEGENVLSNLGSKDIVKKQFYIKDNTKEGEKHKFNFEVISPIQEESICVEEKGEVGSGKWEVDVPIQIAVVSSNKEFEYKKLKFKFKLTLDRYDLKNNEKKIKDKNYEKNIYKKDIKFDLGEIDFKGTENGKLYITYDDGKLPEDLNKIKNINKIINLNLNKCLNPDKNKEKIVKKKSN